MTSAFAGPSVACRAQNETVPVAFTPNVLADGVDDDDELHAASVDAASAAAPAMTTNCLEWARVIAIRLS